MKNITRFMNCIFDDVIGMDIGEDYKQYICNLINSRKDKPQIMATKDVSPIFTSVFEKTFKMDGKGQMSFLYSEYPTLRCNYSCIEGAKILRIAETNHDGTSEILKFFELDDNIVIGTKTIITPFDTKEEKFYIPRKDTKIYRRQLK